MLNKKGFFVIVLYILQCKKCPNHTVLALSFNVTIFMYKGTKSLIHVGMELNQKGSYKLVELFNV